MTRLAPETAEVLFARYGSRLLRRLDVLDGGGRREYLVLGRVVYAQAYTMAFRDCFLIVTLVFALALIPAWIMGRRRKGETDDG